MGLLHLPPPALSLLGLHHRLQPLALRPGHTHVLREHIRTPPLVRLLGASPPAPGLPTLEALAVPLNTKTRKQRVRVRVRGATHGRTLGQIPRPRRHHSGAKRSREHRRDRIAHGATSFRWSCDASVIYVLRAGAAPAGATGPPKSGLKGVLNPGGSCGRSASGRASAKQNNIGDFCISHEENSSTRRRASAAR